MTIWAPKIETDGLLYQQIANAIASDVAVGKLAAGAKLPTQRDLASLLGIAVTTVTRGYAEAERRGLIMCEVGRGTFVRGRHRRDSAAWRPGDDALQTIDLCVNVVFPYAHVSEIYTALAAVGTRGDASAILGYDAHAGAPRHRETGANWIRQSGLDAEADQVLVCSGAQNAIAVTLLTLLSPGDVVLTEELTWWGMKTFARHLGVDLHGLQLDEFGIIPDALEHACRTKNPKALYCMPSVQNPMSCVMPEKRREEIAAIAESHDVAIVEDDTYGFLVGDIKPLSAYAPDRSYYITSASKSLAPALRIGFIRAPNNMVDKLAARICSTIWVASPLLAELFTSLVNAGTAGRIREWKRERVAERRAVVQEVLSEATYRGHPASQHIWLELPEPWRADDFASHARARGVLVTEGEEFMVTRGPAPHAVRVALGMVPNSETLRRGLQILTDLIERPPEPAHSVV